MIDWSFLQNVRLQNCLHMPKIKSNVARCKILIAFKLFSTRLNMERLHVSAILDKCSEVVLSERGYKFKLGWLFHSFENYVPSGVNKGVTIPFYSSCI